MRTPTTSRLSEQLHGDLPSMRQALLAWWGRHGRHDLPWKLNRRGRPPAPGEPLDPYPIWVAEVMLQQTRLAVMLPYWRSWMGRFPDPDALAGAAEQDLLHLWQGLGYYVRARRLQQGVLRLRQGGGGWPRSLEGWTALPGIGRSTAGSILSSAFDLPAAILDGNVRRILARLLAHPAPPAAQQARFWDLSEELLDARRPRSFNQALMDLGATVCTPRRPCCPSCPWRAACAAYAAGDPRRWPVKEAPRPLPFHVIGVGIVIDDAGRVLIDQRPAEGLLGGLWEFPGGKQEAGEAITATIRRELAEELAIEVEVGPELLTLEHAYSHRRLRIVAHLCRHRAGEPRPIACQQVRWVAAGELDAYPFPAANGRILAALRRHLAALPAGGHPEGSRSAER